MSLINDKHDCRRLKLAIIATHPIQYQVPLWRILSTHPSLDLEVFYGTDMSVRGYCDAEFGRDVRWDVPLTTGYRHTFLSTDPTINEVTPFQPWAWHLWRHLRRFRPDVALLNAYGAIFWIQSAAMLRLLRIPIILRHEASDEAVARGTSKACVRDLFLRAFYSQVATFAVIGKSAREHLGRLGVKSRKMISAPYHVDSTLMTNLAATWLPRRHVLRTEMGVLPMDCVLIFSGKLIPKKIR